MKSIRRDLLLALLCAMAVAVAAGAVGTYWEARAEADEMFDYHLRQFALSLRDQAFQSARPPELGEDEESFDFVIQVWGPDGVRLYFSHPHSALPERAQLGFATVRTPEGAWRVYATAMRGQVIQVAQPLSVRNELAVAAAMKTLAPFLLLLPVLAGLIWVVVGRGLAPLKRVAGAVMARTPAALDPLPEGDVPVEALPLIHSLNDLLARLKAALEAQRAFVADAAHELRTPLTALQLQVQLAGRVIGEEERAAALAELRLGLQRTTHAVEQLLTLARVEPGAAENPMAPVSLAELERLVIAAHVRLAEAKGVDLGAAATDEAAVVVGDFEALRILLANLIENAVRYTPGGGRVDVSGGVAGGRPFIEVSDSGPGIPPAERQRVFDRFYRRAETTEPGTGLGLAIVKAIADRHGATVTLGDAPGGGLRARVDFPAR